MKTKATQLRLAKTGVKTTANHVFDLNDDDRPAKLVDPATPPQSLLTRKIKRKVKQHFSHRCSPAYGGHQGNYEGPRKNNTFPTDAVP